MKDQVRATRRGLVIAALLALPSLLFFQSARAGGPLRDGSHDFDWEIGLWKTHLKVLRHKPDGTAAWITYQGTSDVVPIWNGRANMVELDAIGPDGRHIQAINLRLYDPRSHQWSLNFANAATGAMGVPTIGEFHHGVGIFYDQESVDGRVVLVRDVWSNITPNSGHFVQAISDDGGKTWHPNWIADDTRIADPKR